ncbi:MAG TPA: DUF2332 domain-containing protein [Candidatus Binatia bacterium]|nr:DUF2332 domain-containing protein [Candidatus Binatia bacterium]
MSADVLAHLKEQAGFCEYYGSRFTGELIRSFALDLEAGGPIASLVGDWPTNPRADALALRLTGALHAAALSGRDPELAELYPNARAEWRMDDVWPVARAFLERERDWVADFIKSAPQTNEVRRSIALLAGFLTFAETWQGPIDLLEIGASAGLNVNWDRFRYRTQSWSWGGESPVEIDTNWSGATPPVEAQPNIRHRAACDLNPLDINDPYQLLRLRSYIWPDQPERLARFDGAVELARQSHVKVERADAGEWLKQKLKARAPGAATIVYHSIFLQYPPRETRAAIVGAIREAGEAATPEAPLAWVRLEPEALTDGVRDSVRMVVDLTTWPGGERRILAYTDGHVRAVHAV